MNYLYIINSRVGKMFLIIILGMLPNIMFAQKLAVKTNALGWGMAVTMNAGVESKLGNHFTGELSLYYNPFSYGSNKKFSGLLVQPELRFWPCIPFYKHFVGVHAIYSDYNVGWTRYRYQGNLFGAGVSYGYQMILSKRLNLEFNIGLGYARMNHDKYDQPKCGVLIGRQHDNFIGVTKLGVSLIYLLNFGHSK